MSRNVFTNEFVNSGGTKPPDNVCDLITKIEADVATGASKNIGEYIVKHMGMFMNNRVGTYLNDIETKNIRKDDKSQFRKGEIAVYEESHDTYKFCMYNGREGNTAVIYTKNDPKNKDIIKKNMNYLDLIHYSRYDKIIQDYQPHVANLNEDDLLETYIVGK